MGLVPVRGEPVEPRVESPPNVTFETGSSRLDVEAMGMDMRMTPRAESLGYGCRSRDDGCRSRMIVLAGNLAYRRPIEPDQRRGQVSTKVPSPPARSRKARVRLRTASWLRGLAANSARS